MPSGQIATPFRRPVLVWLAGVSAASLALTVAVLVVQPGGEIQSFGADSFSRSALGHRAFVELLRASGVPVVVSRYASAERAGRSSLLVIAEPQLGTDGPARARRLQSMVAAAGVTLLVLPKWSGQQHPVRPGWISAATLLDEQQVGRTLKAAQVPASVVRTAAPGSCDNGAFDAPSASPQLLAATSDALRPVISCSGGVLLAEMSAPNDARLFILADPDVLSNHGLAQGSNAGLALEVLRRARRPGQPVVLDESLHGFERVPSLWREMLFFPLLPATLQALLALLALVWSGLPRFGAPHPDVSAHASGKVLLIENVASLQRSAGHSAHNLGRYLEAAISDVARALHAPSANARARPSTWLRNNATRRGVRSNLSAIEGRIAALRAAAHPAPSAIVRAARDVHRWRKEMLRGPQDDSGR